MRTSVRLSLFPPGGPPDAAPVAPEAPLCSDVSSFSTATDEVRIETGLLDLGALLLRIPTTYEPRAFLAPLPFGGAIWGEKQQWAWGQGQGEAEHLPNALPAFALWIGRNAGYPTIGAPYGTEMGARSECRRQLERGTAHVTSFILSLSGAAPRYCVAAVWLTRSTASLQALFHVPTSDDQNEGLAIVHSLEFDTN